MSGTLLVYGERERGDEEKVRKREGQLQKVSDKNMLNTVRYIKNLLYLGRFKDHTTLPPIYSRIIIQ